MSGEEIQHIKPGPAIGPVTYLNSFGLRREAFTLCEGILPETSDENVHAFVAVDCAHGFDQAAVAIDDTAEEGVRVDLDLRSPDILQHPGHLKGLIQVALAESGVQTDKVVAGRCPPPKILKLAGLKPDQSGDHLELKVAA